MAHAIELESTNDLLDELMKRFDHAIFAGMLVPTTDPKGVGRLDEIRKMVGNTRTCQGLAMGHILMAQAQYDERCLEQDEHGD